MTKLDITYKLTVKGKEVELSQDEARDIYNALKVSFGDKPVYPVPYYPNTTPFWTEPATPATPMPNTIPIWCEHDTIS